MKFAIFLHVYYIENVHEDRWVVKKEKNCVEVVIDSSLGADSIDNQPYCMISSFDLFLQLFLGMMVLFVHVLIATPTPIPVLGMSMGPIIICIVSLSVVLLPITISKWIHINFEIFT